MILEFDPEANKEVWRVIHNPTIGDVRSLRRKGAVILFQKQWMTGNEIHKMWVTGNGTPVVYSSEWRVQS